MRFHKIPNQAFAGNFTCLSQKLVNPLFYLSSYFLFLKNFTYLVTSATFSQYFLFNNTTAKDFHPITFPENLQLPRWMCKWKVAVYPSVFNIWKGKSVCLKGRAVVTGDWKGGHKQPQNLGFQKGNRKRNRQHIDYYQPPQIWKPNDSSVK